MICALLGAARVTSRGRAATASCRLLVPKSSMTKDRYVSDATTPRTHTKFGQPTAARSARSSPATFRSDSSDLMWYLLMRFTAQGRPSLSMAA